MDAGEVIRENRKKAGYTLSKLSLKTGISLSFLSDVERGRRNLGVENALKIAAVLNIDFTELLPDETLKIIEEQKKVQSNSASPTLAANRTDSYGDDLPEEAREELQNYIDYLKVKYKKK